MSYFSCKDCILIGICSKPCPDRSYDVSPFMLTENVCIDCGGTEYYENVYDALYYMICVNCLSTYFISENKQSGFIFRSQSNKLAYKHINRSSGKLYPKRLFSGCIDRWKKWHKLREDLE